MFFNSFSDVLIFIHGQGYFIFFILMVLEGPIVNTAASFAASLGYFNIFIIFLLAVLGDLTGDLIYFYIGKASKIILVEKYENKIGFAKKNISFIEKNIKKHFFKTMLFIKLTPGFASVGLMFVGASKVRLIKFILNSLLISIPACIFFTSLGYYGGISFDIFFRYFKIGQYAIFGSILLILILFYVYKKLTARIYKKVYEK